MNSLLDLDSIPVKQSERVTRIIALYQRLGEMMSDLVLYGSMDRPMTQYSDHMLNMIMNCRNELRELGETVELHECTGYELGRRIWMLKG